MTAMAHEFIDAKTGSSQNSLIDTITIGVPKIMDPLIALPSATVVPDSKQPIHDVRIDDKTTPLRRICHKAHRFASMLVAAPPQPS